MSILASEIKQRLSITTGSSGNYQSQSNVNSSLGGYISTTDVVDSTLNNLFDDISGVENSGEVVDYRCIFLYNTNNGLTYTNAGVYIGSQVAGGASIQIGLDPSGVSYAGGVGPQGTIVADENTAPDGVSFSNPTTQGTALSIGNIPASSCIGIWIQRTANNTSPVANDGATLVYFGDTL